MIKGLLYDYYDYFDCDCYTIITTMMFPWCMLHFTPTHTTFVTNNPLVLVFIKTT